MQEKSRKLSDEELEKAVGGAQFDGCTCRAISDDETFARYFQYRSDRPWYENLSNNPMSNGCPHFSNRNTGPSAVLCGNCRHLRW